MTAAALTCLESTERLSRSLVESTVGSQGISLSLFVYKLLPVLTVPGVWVETITASLHSQIILQRNSLHSLESQWILARLPYLGSPGSEIRAK